MARHRKKAVLHRRSSSRKRASFPKGMWWLIGLFMSILGVSSLYHLYGAGQLTHYNPLLLKPVHDRPHTKTPPPATVERRASSKTRRQANHIQPLPKQEIAQRFEFYQLLPGLEVPLPDPITPAPRVSRPMLPPVATSNDTLHQTSKQLAKSKTKSVPVYSKQAAPHYMIQAKAYRHSEGAEQLKNRLRGLGFKVKNQQVEAEDGTWFRVMIGPFASEAMAVEQKKRLQQYQIHGILILQR